MGIKSSVIAILGSTNAVAKVCGVTHGAVSQWGQDIPAKHISALVKAGVPLSVFYPDIMLTHNNSED